MSSAVLFVSRLSIKASKLRSCDSLFQYHMHIIGKEIDFTANALLVQAYISVFCGDVSLLLGIFHREDGNVEIVKSVLAFVLNEISLDMRKKLAYQ